MKIRRLEISGFRGFRELVDIPLGTGFTVITGRNGAGKTTVCDAIEYLLTRNLGRFDQSVTEKGERINDYLWWRGNPPAQVKRVKAVFAEGKGHEHSVEVSSSSTRRQDFSFLVGDSEDAESKISLLCQTAILRNEFIPGLSTDLRETERFEFVNRAIGVSDLTNIEKISTAAASDLANSAKAIELEYSKSRDSVARLTSEITELRARHKPIDRGGFEILISTIAKRLGAETTELGAISSMLRNRIASLRRELERLERLNIDMLRFGSQLAQAQSMYAQIATTQREIADCDVDLRKALDQRNEIDEKLRAQRERSPENAALAVLIEQGGRIGLHNGLCPLCGSALSDADFVAHIKLTRDEIQNQNAELARLTAAQAEAESSYSARKQQYDTKSLELSRLLSESDSLQLISKQLSEEAEKLAVKLDPQSLRQALDDRKADLKELETYFESVESEGDNDRLLDLNRQKSQSQEEADRLAKRIELISRAVQDARLICDTAKRISREIIEDRLAALNPLLSELYSRLKPHVAYDEVKYRMRGDVLRFLRLEVGDEINPRFTFSSGQRRALGLAFLLSVYLTRPWCKLRTLILDDPAQHIDDYRALHLAEVLSSIRQLGHQVICTAEDPALAMLLCRRLRSSSRETGILVELEYTADRGVRVSRTTEIAPLPERVLVAA